MKFKTQKQENEFTGLTQFNPKLSMVLLLLNQYTEIEFGRPITVTDLFRSQEDHDLLYANTTPDKRPKSSPHMFWKAADLRAKDFTEAQIKKLLVFVNCFTYTSGQGRPVGIYHAITGNVHHFHIQCD